jgi:hypothetical protein
MGGDRRHDGNWMVQRKLDGEGLGNGDLTTMDNKEWCEHDDDVDTAGGGRDKGHSGIKI